MKRREVLYTALLVLCIIYVVTTLFAPLAPNRFNLTTAETRMLQMTIALPVIAIWAIGLYGAERFKHYAQSIIKYPDGEGMNKVSTGLLLLVAAIVINSVLGAFRPWALRDDWLSLFTITANYIAVVVPLAAYIYIYKGSQSLKKVAKIKNPSRKKTFAVLALLLLIGILYIKTFQGYEFRSDTPDPATHTSFYLSDPLILMTIIIPNLIAWGLGLKAAINLADYKHHIKGSIYKKAIKRLVTGIVLVIGFAVFLQLVISLSTYFATAKLGSILAALYLLILMYGVGYLFIASGAKKLAKIEKVK